MTEAEKKRYLGIYYGDDNKPCDYCGDIYHRNDLVYISPEYNEDPEKMIWTVKLCGPCLNVIIVVLPQIGNRFTYQHG